MNPNAHGIEERIIRLADAFTGQLPSHDIEMVKSLARANECGIALENLATQLHEYDIEVAPALYEEIARLGAAMQLDELYWTSLAVGK